MTEKLSEFEREQRKIMRETKELEEKAKKCVLTVSASDYVTSVNKELRNYMFQGVNAYERAEVEIFADCGYDEQRIVEHIPYLSAQGGLAKICEDLEAEVIVDVKPTVIPSIGRRPNMIYLIGTALIPKEKYHKRKHRKDSE